jgi:hypothetical protein
MKTFDQLDIFARAYITAAFWTTSEDLPGYDGARESGCDFRTTGRTDELFSLLAESTVAEIEADCARFQVENAELLAMAGTAEQNGHDFWLTRNHHSVGFWDRGYPKEIGDTLAAAAHAAGEAYIYTGDDGRIYA